MGASFMLSLCLPKASRCLFIPLLGPVPDLRGKVVILSLVSMLGVHYQVEEILSTPTFLRGLVVAFSQEWMMDFCETSPHPSPANQIIPTGVPEINPTKSSILMLLDFVC